jgi:hypothetical protein
LLVASEDSCCVTNAQNVHTGLICCHTCQTESDQEKVPPFAIACGFKACSMNGDPLKSGAYLKGSAENSLGLGTSSRQHLPMCFEKIEDAFTDLDCPLGGLGASGTVPASSQNTTEYPKVITTSLEWRLNEKQHCAVVILCATLLRKYVQKTLPTVDNVAW